MAIDRKYEMTKKALILKYESADWQKTMRGETIERVFADAKEKHAMRYTNHRGLTRVKNRVRLKFAAMNLKLMAMWAFSRRRVSQELKEGVF